ncbi:MAG: alpha/beta hydrolase [Thiovulaceae bacterium]|nr:alpha/beta hydrolase [Sulfurimonadaceae bacterium]
MAIKSIQYKQHTFQISYDILHPEKSTPLIFLHGWGSNKELMKQSFEKTMDTFRHIYIDLPGFGNSSCNFPLNTEDYANIVELFLAQINANQDHIVLGHSFGGKVALLLNPKILILLGSSGIPVPKPLKIRAKIALFKMLKFLGFSKLRSLFAAEDAKKLNHIMYQTFKNVVNEDLTPAFKAYSGKALLCWGKEDTATPLFTAQKINKLIADSRLVVYNGDHYFFMKQAGAVAREIETTVLASLQR